MDFTVRDPDGRFYQARVDQFSPAPELGLLFVGTDFDEFEVECEVVAIFYNEATVLVRPVEVAAVPGTAGVVDAATVQPQRALGVPAEQATDELVRQP